MNQGFFTSEELGGDSSGGKKRGGQPVGCGACGLDASCKSPRMEIGGRGEKNVLMLAEAPGRVEDARGTQLVGEAGVYLRETLEDRTGLSLDSDCWKLSSVNCRIPQGRKKKDPEPWEIDCCRPRVLDSVTKYSPSLIVPFGGSAMYSLLGGREGGGGNEGIALWRGAAIPDQVLGSWILPTYNPSQVLRGLDNRKPDNALQTIFHSDISRIKEYIDRPLPDYSNMEKFVSILETESEVISLLRRILKEKPYISFDYEATGLKPFDKGHKLVLVSVAFKGRAYCFSMTERIRPIWAFVLKDPEILKTSHGSKFEEIWSRTKIGTRVRGWDWCSMNAAHVLDNRRGYNGLKLQTYLNFGVPDYSTRITPYLKGLDEKNANSFNRIHEAPRRELMIYCGLDSLFGLLLTEKQKKEMRLNRPMYRAFKELTMPGLDSFADHEESGIKLNRDYLLTQKKFIQERRVPRIKKKIMNYPEVGIWRQLFPDNFNLASPDQLAKILFGYKKIKPQKHTEKGKPSVSSDSLEMLEDPLVTDIMEFKRLEGLTGKLNTILKESNTDRVRSFFHLHTTKSYRSSSSNINFQNLPIRDPDSKKVIRGGFIPRPGNQLMEIDYSGVEVAVSACVHKDPNMINYVVDATTDMHRDEAEEIFLLPRELVSKELRQAAKGGFVFPQFYGDYFDPCAEAIWLEITKYKWTLNNSEQTAKNHLYKEGIRTLDDFKKHMSDVEYRFWNDKFGVYAEWKDIHLKEYGKKGYFDLLTGFRCGGYMKKNEALNLPIQGPAFHCLLWSDIKLTRIFRREGLRSLLIGQIHDAIIIDAVPEEIPYIAKIAKKVMCDDLREAWDWLIVPMKIDIETTPIEGSWNEKTKYKELVGV